MAYEPKDTPLDLIGSTDDIDELRAIVRMLSEKKVDPGYIRTGVMKIHFLQSLIDDDVNATE